MGRRETEHEERNVDSEGEGRNPRRRIGGGGGGSSNAGEGVLGTDGVHDSEHGDDGIETGDDGDWENEFVGYHGELDRTRAAESRDEGDAEEGSQELEGGRQGTRMRHREAEGRKEAEAARTLLRSGQVGRDRGATEEQDDGTGGDSAEPDGSGTGVRGGRGSQASHDDSHRREHYTDSSSKVDEGDPEASQRELPARESTYESVKKLSRQDVASIIQWCEREQHPASFAADKLKVKPRTVRKVSAPRMMMGGL
jgi:hypothetical protein